jgi:hypothetical protein
MKSVTTALNAIQDAPSTSSKVQSLMISLIWGTKNIPPFIPASLIVGNLCLM